MIFGAILGTVEVSYRGGEAVGSVEPRRYQRKIIGGRRFGATPARPTRGEESSRQWNQPPAKRAQRPPKWARLPLARGHAKLYRVGNVAAAHRSDQSVGRCRAH
jgi:hypothetical protein